VFACIAPMLALACIHGNFVNSIGVQDYKMAVQFLWLGTVFVRGMA
jgi:hypothetical protein